MFYNIYMLRLEILSARYKNTNESLAFTLALLSIRKLATLGCHSRAAYIYIIKQLQNF